MQSRRRRRAIAESSDEEEDPPPLAPAPGSVAEISRVTDDSKRPKLEARDVAVGANVTGGVTSPLPAPKVPPTAQKTQAKRARSATRAARSSPTSTSNPGTEIPIASAPSGANASTTPVSNQASEVDEQSKLAKLRTAARQYLRSNQMEERLQALKKLSHHGLQIFYERNKDRKKGEWCWGPVDERIGKSNLAEAVGTIPPTSTNPSKSDIVEGVDSILPEATDAKASDLNCKPGQRKNEIRRADSIGVSRDSARDDRAASGDSTMPVCAKTAPALSSLAKAESISEKYAVKPELAAVEPRSKRELGKPELATAEPTSKHDAGKSTPIKPVLVEEGARHGYPTRYGPRIFTPVFQRRSGSRELTAPTSFRLPVVDVTSNASQRSSTPPTRSSGCRHIQCEQPSSDNGCHWVCSKCGEMLFYDGWVRERVAPTHLEPMSRGMRGVDHLETAGDV